MIGVLCICWLLFMDFIFVVVKCVSWKLFECHSKMESQKLNSESKLSVYFWKG